MASVEIVVMRPRSGGPRGTRSAHPFTFGECLARTRPGCVLVKPRRAPEFRTRCHANTATSPAASRTSPCRFRSPPDWGCRRFYPFQMFEAGTEVPAPHLPVGHGVSPAEQRACSHGAGVSALPMGGRPACERYKPDHRRPRLPRILETPCSCGVAYDIRCRATVQTFSRAGAGAAARSAGSLARASRAALRSAHVHSPQSSLNCRRHR
jgi:hypothetical protein